MACLALSLYLLYCTMDPLSVEEDDTDFFSSFLVDASSTRSRDATAVELPAISPSFLHDASVIIRASSPMIRRGRPSQASRDIHNFSEHLLSQHAGVALEPAILAAAPFVVADLARRPATALKLLPLDKSVNLYSKVPFRIQPLRDAMFQAFAIVMAKPGDVELDDGTKKCLPI